MSVQHAGLPKVSFLRERSPWVGRWGAWVIFVAILNLVLVFFCLVFPAYLALQKDCVILMQLSFVGGDKDNNTLSSSSSSSSVYFGLDI
jgi:hypothetical protein